MLMFEKSQQPLPVLTTSILDEVLSTSDGSGGEDDLFNDLLEFTELTPVEIPTTQQLRQEMEPFLKIPNHDVTMQVDVSAPTMDDNGGAFSIIVNCGELDTFKIIRIDEKVLMDTLNTIDNSYAGMLNDLANETCNWNGDHGGYESEMLTRKCGLKVSVDFWCGNLEKFDENYIQFFLIQTTKSSFYDDQIDITTIVDRFIESNDNLPFIFGNSEQHTPLVKNATYIFFLAKNDRSASVALEKKEEGEEETIQLWHKYMHPAQLLVLHIGDSGDDTINFQLKHDGLLYYYRSDNSKMVLPDAETTVLPFVSHLTCIIPYSIPLIPMVNRIDVHNINVKIPMYHPFKMTFNGISYAVAVSLLRRRYAQRIDYFYIQAAKAEEINKYLDICHVKTINANTGVYGTLYIDILKEQSKVFY